MFINRFRIINLELESNNFEKLLDRNLEAVSFNTTLPMCIFEINIFEKNILPYLNLFGVKSEFDSGNERVILSGEMSRHSRRELVKKLNERILDSEIGIFAYMSGEKGNEQLNLRKKFIKSEFLTTNPNISLAEHLGNSLLKLGNLRVGELPNRDVVVYGFEELSMKEKNNNMNYLRSVTEIYSFKSIF